MELRGEPADHLTAPDTVGVTTIDLAYSTDGGETYPFVIGTELFQHRVVPLGSPDG